MSFYSTYVLPRITDFVMRNEENAKQRAKLVPRAEGDVLEVAIGSGLNLAHYGNSVRRLFGVDPSPRLLQMARARTRGLPFPVELVERSAEMLPFDDATMDTVVVTWGLCSVPNPIDALREMKRVLKPSGRLLFVEHGKSSDPAVGRWQDRMNPIWKAVAGGCNLNRPIDELVRAAGFQIAELRTEYLPGPRLMTFTYHGAAA
jgi:ubiquinone/menaquinone biosynthesis C-methylase UbiE